MGTRSGDLDAGIISYIMEREKLDAAGINALLNKKSGFLGVFGKSSDARDIESAASQGDKRAILTLNLLYYRVLKYIGAYTAAMNGCDLIVFTGGIGENDPHIREMVGTHLEYLGVDFDQNANKGVRGKDVILTKQGSRVKMATVTTNEELVIAQDTMKLV